MAQIGVEDTETLLAELNSELSADEVMSLVNDPDTYMGLMQLAAETDAVPETDAYDMFAQTDSYEEDFGDVEQLLGQLDTAELNKLTDMLAGVNEGLSLAQGEAKNEKSDNQEVLD